MAFKKYWFSKRQKRLTTALGGDITIVKYNGEWREFTQSVEDSDEAPNTWKDFILVAEGENLDTLQGKQEELNKMDIVDEIITPGKGDTSMKYMNLGGNASLKSPKSSKSSESYSKVSSKSNSKSSDKLDSKLDSKVVPKVSTPNVKDNVSNCEVNDMATISSNFRTRIKNANAWKSTKKKEYYIWAKEANIGQKIYNYLENSDYITTESKNIVLSGTRGEQWVTDAAHMMKSYRTKNGTPISRLNHSTYMNNGWTLLKTCPSSSNVFALQIPIAIKNFPVQTAWGDILYANSINSEGHGSGDFLVCESTANNTPDLDNVWVVNHDIFLTTYDLTNFLHDIGDLDNMVNIGVASVPQGWYTRNGFES